MKSNQQALERAHQVLQQPYQANVEFSWEFYHRHCEDFAPLRNLARAFLVEASLARREQRDSDAVRIALDAMRLGAAVRNGGLITDLLVGMALTGTASSFLRQCRIHLDADTALAAAREILRTETSLEPFAAIAERDSQWETAVGNRPQETLPPPPQDDSTDTPCDEETFRAVKAMVEQYAALPPEVHRRDQLQLDHRQTATLRLLAAELALRAYHERHGNYPEQLAQLVPDWLSHTADDPFSGQPLVYRREAERFVLYSVGPNGKDEGGRFGSWTDISSRGGDLCLDYEEFSFSCPCSANPSFRQRLRSWLRQTTRALRRLLSKRS